MVSGSVRMLDMPIDWLKANEGYGHQDVKFAPKSIIGRIGKIDAEK